MASADTLTIHDTLIVHDTLTIRDTLTIHDSLIVHDTVEVPVFVHDTTTIHDTIMIHDTVGTELNYHNVTILSSNIKRGLVVGSGRFPECTEVEIAAIPLRGSNFVSWNDGITSQIRTITVNEDIALCAVFIPWGRTGIDDVENVPYEVYSEQGGIMVKDALNERVRVFDVAGRVLYQGRIKEEPWRFKADKDGVYLVQIADSPAQKVVVVE